MKLSIVHHHFRRGGVSKVVDLGVKALLSQGIALDSITLISGSDQAPTEDFQDHRVQSLLVPEFAYSSESPEGSSTDADQIEKILTKHCKDSILWVHNYQLGKNPPFTQGLIQFAQRNSQTPVFLQIHDFPECGRYTNVQALYQGMNGPLYPRAANITYLLINPRDKQLLQNAGMREEELFLLDNPLDPPEQELGIPNHRRSTLRSRLGSLTDPELSGTIDPHLPMFFYPVRCIRRKNVLEAALICLLYPGKANLLLTLPGTSSQEKAYSREVQTLFEEGLVPGLFGLGQALDQTGIDFEEVAKSCDLILSSSVQEGFGYFFVDALSWGRPLLARKLDMLSGIEPLFGSYPKELYRSIRVPLGKEGRENLKSRYREKIGTLSGYISTERQKILEEEMEILFSKQACDFSYLDIDSQKSVLKRCKDSDYLDNLRKENKALIQAAEGLCMARPTPPLSTISRELGPEAFARRSEELLSKALNRIKTEKTHEAAAATEDPREDPIHRKLLEAFSQSDYIRLLYDA